MAVAQKPCGCTHAESAWLGETSMRRTPAYTRWIQSALNRVDNAGLVVDGIIGPKTRNAVRAFQGRKGLAVDGVVGPRTEAALIAAGAPQPPGAGPSAAPVLCRPVNLATPQLTAASVTSYLETGVPFGCAVSPVDGISMGMLQWNLAAGTLQAMLELFEHQTGRLGAFFGGDRDRVARLMVLRHTADERRRAVNEAKAENLAERWRAPLLGLCGDAAFCALLMRDVTSRMSRAQSVARQLGLGTIRGLTMCFDINVGDGLSDAKAQALAARIRNRESSLGRTLGERERLVEIAHEAADRIPSDKWREERRARRLVIANGRGHYRRGEMNLDSRFPTLDQRWE